MIDASRDRGVDVLGIGVAVRDIALRLDGLPEPDRKYRVKDLQETGGGPVPTALVTLARFGRRTAFAGVLGDDGAGRWIEDGLRREKVDVRGVVRRRGFRSPASVILVEERGRRAILEYAQYDLPLGLEEVLARIPDPGRCRFFLADARLVEIQREVARRVRAGGGRVVLDCGHPRPGVEDLLAVSDAAILSHSYPETVLGAGYDPARFLADLGRRLPRDGPRIAGLTLGEEGCALHTPEAGFVRIPGHPVEAVDSTGAGDVFHGAFVHAWAGGATPVEAARFANVAAALKCTGMSGRHPLPPESEIRRRM